MSIRLPVTVSCVALAATLFCVPCVAVWPAVAQEAACAPITAVETPPPPLPIYEQPPVPGPGYLWSPGYWSWDVDQGDYYWVPGTWAQPPRPGLLWTPGYWGWFAGAYIFHPGYWGERVGFYGGVNYGFGYTGAGYEGGRWDHGVFAYNRAVNNLQGTTIRNVYEKNVVVNQTINNISYNGGRGGSEARPTAADRAIAKQPHFAPTPLQRKHVEVASQDPKLFKKANGGVPAVGATARPGDLRGPGVVRARPVGEVVPANGARPAREELKRPEPGPAESPRKALQEKEPPMRDPARETRPPVEERRAAPIPETRVEPRAAPEATTSPAVRESRPAMEERRPEEIRRAEPKPEPMARPEPSMRPEPRVQMGAPPTHGAPAGGRPGGEEERRPEQR